MYVEVRPHIYDDKTPETEKEPYVANGDTIQGTTNPGLNELTTAAEPLIQRANHIAATLDGMITRLNNDVLSGTSTQDLKITISQLRDMVNNGDSMVKHADQFMQDADALIRQAKDGKGTLGLLLNDRQTRDNVRDLIENMKEHGPVFYRNDAGDQKKK
jgi:hypothetical protein